MKRWQSLWSGPTIHDAVEDQVKDGLVFTSTWRSMGLYALDCEDQAWTLCVRYTQKGVTRWLRVDDLVSGAAARQTHLEEESR